MKGRGRGGVAEREKSRRPEENNRRMKNMTAVDESLLMWKGWWRAGSGTLRKFRIDANVRPSVMVKGG